MAGLVLVIGTKNYSSWSLRPWMLLRHLGLPFEERLVHFTTPEFLHELPGLSPTARVPLLIHGSLRVWESLAICEYLSELADGRGWPQDPTERARARALASEMHAGFARLRTACPMNARARNRRVDMDEGLQADIRRIDAIFAGRRTTPAGHGPWLFGRYGAADAMFAPVVLRFLTYGLPLGPQAQQYFETALADPALQDWIRAAESETQFIAKEEVGQSP